jgi:hypothetical protein
MQAILCGGCSSLPLEFFVGEENPLDSSIALDSIDDGESFELVTSTAYSTSLVRLRDSARVGCELCTMILKRIEESPNMTIDEEDFDVTALMDFDRLHRLAVHFKERILFLPVYSDLLTGYVLWVILFVPSCFFSQLI